VLRSQVTYQCRVATNGNDADRGNVQVGHHQGRTTSGRTQSVLATRCTGCTY
jgi:hypothetical protein